MKVIGLTEVPNPHNAHIREKAFVVIVTEAELAKVAGKAGHREFDGNAIKVGDDYPLAEGWDFRKQLDEAISKMVQAYEQFAKVAPIAAQFAGIVQRKVDNDGSAK